MQMRIPSIANKIDHEIFTESLPKLRRKGEHPHNTLHVIRIHMQNRSISIFDNIRRMRGGTRVQRIGRKPDLVIQDNVNGPVCREGGKVAEMQGLIHHPLAREGRVAVHQQRTHLLAWWDV